MAHSYGGEVTTSLFSANEESFTERVFAVCFTDSVHNPLKSNQFGKFVSMACNWVCSKDPLDKPQQSYKMDVPRVSAGVTKHESTSHSCFHSVFDFIHRMLERTTQELIPETPYGESDVILSPGHIVEKGLTGMADKKMRVINSKLVGTSDKRAASDDYHKLLYAGGNKSTDADSKVSLGVGSKKSVDIDSKVSLGVGSKKSVDTDGKDFPDAVCEKLVDFTDENLDDAGSKKLFDTDSKISFGTDSRKGINFGNSGNQVSDKMSVDPQTMLSSKVDLFTLTKPEDERLIQSGKREKLSICEELSNDKNDKVKSSGHIFTALTKSKKASNINFSIENSASKTNNFGPSGEHPRNFSKCNNGESSGDVESMGVIETCTDLAEVEHPEEEGDASCFYDTLEDLPPSSNRTYDLAVDGKEDNPKKT